ncbi:uncharacterized protein SCHCODRAFT_02630187 [Schizophyllum commune H4-8]|uniref:uncharacterized protein n=1 Tax=Schizophyllum commune (strain H4-8 / FGSC 9210) TaxID=578458 RepID=UPI00215FC5A4|nr:uncharacterized protein SCHCODRAFT_02630187 [Schizophyllum commune H4-8]KAI5891846.1 hypothetical protein SCHCODRAFT_02630187 [Schizophyllum commune H4-8]
MFTFPSAPLRHVKTQKRPILTQQHLLATSMSQQIRELTIIFIPDPPLAHTVTSSKKGTPFEMARLFDPESAKHLFQSAPGCWLEKERAESADDGEENADASHELVEDRRQLVNDGRETVDASKEAAHAGEGITDAAEDTAEGGQNSRIARDMIIWEWVSICERQQSVKYNDQNCRHTSPKHGVRYPRLERT